MNLKANIKDLVKMTLLFLRKNKLSFLYVNDLRQNAMTLTLNNHLNTHSLSFTEIVGCRPLAAIVSEISTVFPFSFKKAQVSNFELAIK